MEVESDGVVHFLVKRDTIIRHEGKIIERIESVDQSRNR